MSSRPLSTVSWRLVCLTSLGLLDQMIALGCREGGAALCRLGRNRGDLPMAPEKEKLPDKRVWALGRKGVTCTRVWAGHFRCERKAALHRLSSGQGNRRLLSLLGR